ncbi:MAG TPA: hypothetical protein VNE61_05625 [Ktedonobacteraceae bacterium]|nr:hypothetical protein [Ktedonobacteraceae bacterium]
MSSHPPPNAGRFPIGPYVVQFVEQELCFAQASEPDAALDLTDWLALSRQRLFATVMHDGLETFKARVRTEYHLPEPEESEARPLTSLI